MGFLSRSRSLRGGGGPAADQKAHGPDIPVAGEPGLVSDPNSSTQDLVENQPLPTTEDPSEEENTYRHRPLPRPPPRKDPVAMMPPPRPRSSDGGSQHGGALGLPAF